MEKISSWRLGERTVGGQSNRGNHKKSELGWKEQAEVVGGTREEAEGTETSSGAGSDSGEDLKRASATTFWMPGTCTTELVNSARWAR